MGIEHVFIWNEGKETYFGILAPGIQNQLGDVSAHRAGLLEHDQQEATDHMRWVKGWLAPIGLHHKKGPWGLPALQNVSGTVAQEQAWPAHGRTHLITV